MGVRAILFVITALVAGLAPAPAAFAQDVPDVAPTELVIAASAVFRALPDEGRVDVTFTYDVDNAGTEVEFPGFFESLPDDAVDVEATVTGTDSSLPLTATVTAFGSSDGFTQWFVAFDQPLGPGEGVDVTLRWSFADGAGTPAAAVRPGLVSLTAYVPGMADREPGLLFVEVPAGYTTNDTLLFNDGPLADEEAVGTRFLVPQAAAAYQPVPVAFVDRDQFAERTVDLPPMVTIAEWGADGWTDAVEDRASAVVASLDRWFGPRDAPLLIERGLDERSSVTGAGDRVVIVDATATAIDRQLAHAWLADLDVDETWFAEGLAAAFAGATPDPETSAVIMPDLVAEMGPDGVRAVVDALRAEAITYPGAVELPQPLDADWRTVLDLMEGVGGSTAATDAFRASVVADGGATLLDQRAAARVDYFALEQRAGAWSLPPLLREPIAGWDFGRFAEVQGSVSDALAQRDALAAWAADVGLEPRDDARSAFEEATVDMAEVTEILEAQEAALEAYDEAERVVNGDRGLLARVGLIGHDPDADLAAAAAAWRAGADGEVVDASHEVAELVEGAVGTGTLRLLVPVVVVVALWQGWRRLRKPTPQPEPAREPQPAPEPDRPATSDAD